MHDAGKKYVHIAIVIAVITG